METFLNSTEDRSEEQLTLFAEVSPASHFPKQESAKGLEMSVISGPKCFELFKRSTRYTSWLKTFADCLRSNLEKFTPRLRHNWKSSVTKSQHFVFQLVPSKPRTGGTGSGLWAEDGADDDLLGTPITHDRARSAAFRKGRTPNPQEAMADMLLGTPTAVVRERSPETMKKCADFRKRNANQNTVPLYLAEQIAMLPTPRSSDGEKNVRTDEGAAKEYERKGNGADLTTILQTAMLPTPQPDQPHQANFQRKVEKGYTIDLNSTIALLPTPTTNESEHPDAELTATGRRKSKKGDDSHSLNVPDHIAMLPTPKARDWKGGKGTNIERQSHDLDKVIECMLPTPRAAHSSGGSRAKQAAEGKWQMGVREAIELCPVSEERQNNGKTGLRYQPAFGEWMMGYPLNWTSLETDELIPIGFDVPWIEMAMAICQAERVLGTRDNRAARIKAIGNSIVSGLVYEIFRAIQETEDSNLR